MMRQVIYRKYRPQTFAEVVGQEHVVSTLTNAIALGRVGHAYLFAGSRGTGKTTLARILAKTVNCANVSGISAGKSADTLSIRRSLGEGGPHKSVEPCNKCLSCQEFSKGVALDLVEIDAASNRGIDEIRELREGIRFAPAKAKYKAYIIDEAHQLTKEAFNALLKTLEEPPAHAIFVLATTEVERMPATILSRVQRFDFKKFTVPQIETRLSTLTKAEGVKIEAAALRTVAAAGEGSLRDAERTLEQVIAFSESPITLAHVESILGRVNIEKITGFVDLLSAHNLAGAVHNLHELSDAGINLHEFTKGLIQHLRRAMVLAASPQLKAALSTSLTDEEFAAVHAHANAFPINQLTRVIDRFIRAENELRRSPLPLLPLELAVVQLLLPGDQPRHQA
ncbi:DNA polymerase III subunit gamma/tau [Candidatus Parcubacteria bacterium]|nr:DNA polymerase III subunit gamma/tau [Candidatus Parcubacteria bacterium]